MEWGFYGNLVSGKSKNLCILMGQPASPLTPENPQYSTAVEMYLVSLEPNLNTFFKSEKLNIGCACLCVCVLTTFL